VWLLLHALGVSAADAARQPHTLIGAWPLLLLLLLLLPPQERG
jgi:MYXO-CTERM domain-containing protein